MKYVIFLILFLVVMLIFSFLLLRTNVIVQQQEILYSQEPIPISRALQDVPSTRELKEVLTHQLIPRRVMQTNAYRKVPGIMKEVILYNMSLNPEYEYEYFDDDEAREFLVRHFDERVVKAYDTLVPGAFKADLFRVAYLYEKGGVYMDTGFICLVPFREWIRPEDTFLSPEDDGCTNIFNDQLYNAFIAATPKHEVLKAMMSQILSNVEKRVYNHVLAITGPRAVGIAFRKCVGPVRANKEYRDGIRVNSHNHKLWGNGTVCDMINGKPTPVIITKFLNYHGMQKKYNKPRYEMYYHHRQVYGEPGPLPVTAAPLPLKEKEGEEVMRFIPVITGKIKQEGVNIDSLQERDGYYYIPRKLKGDGIIFTYTPTSNITTKQNYLLQTNARMHADCEYRIFTESGRYKYISTQHPEYLLYYSSLTEELKTRMFVILYLSENDGHFVDINEMSSFNIKEKVENKEVKVLSSPQDIDSIFAA